MLKDYIGKKVSRNHDEIQAQFCKFTGLDYGWSNFFLSQEMNRKIVDGDEYVLDLYVEWDYHEYRRITDIYLQTNFIGSTFKAKSDREVFSEQEKMLAEAVDMQFLPQVTEE